MKLLILFLVTALGGAVGRIGGILAGPAVGPGAGLALQFLFGAVLAVAGVLVAERLGAVRRYQRWWTGVGAVLGVGMATLVTLSTLSAPAAPYFTPALIGMGSALGSLIGKSAHERPDLT